MPLLVCLILQFCVLAIQGFNMARLETRVRILEDKVHHDSKEFREDFDKVFAVINATDEVKRASVENENRQNLPNGTVSQTAERQYINSDVRTLVQVLQVIPEAFVNEKKWIRDNMYNLKMDLNQATAGFQKEIGEVVTAIHDLKQTLENIMKNVVTDVKDISLKSDAMALDLKTVKDNHARAASDIKSLINNNLKGIETLKNEQKEMKTTFSNTAGKVQTLSKEIRLGFFFKVADLIRFQNSFYHIGSNEVSWTKAREECETIGMFLVEDNTQEEHDFLYDLVRTNDIAKQHAMFWLGGNDIGEEGVWRWSQSGKVIETPFWRPDEPNGGTRESCMQLYKDHTDWNDRSCSQTLSYICEYEL